ncbi:MAG: hypothetical protein HY783_02700 [Chloroflexi bacterium]|nr:hypothetical protein [Chloroflexota bacterium]
MANGTWRSSGIDLNLLPVQYRPRGMPWLEASLVLLLLLALALLPLLWSLQAQVDADVSRLQRELGPLQERLRQVRAAAEENRKLREEIDKTQALTKSLEAEHRALVRPGAVWTDLLARALATLAPAEAPGLAPEIKVGSFSYNGKQLTLQGEASSAMVVLQGAKALQGTGQFGRVSVTSLAITGGERESQKVTFTIIAEK